MEKAEDRRELTLQELKDLLFYRADTEMRCYKEACEKYGGQKAEPLRLSYIAVFNVIHDAVLWEEYAEYREIREKEMEEIARSKEKNKRIH